MAEMAADGQRQLVNIRNSLIRFKKRVKIKKSEDGRDVFRVEWKGKKNNFLARSDGTRIVDKSCARRTRTDEGKNPFWHLSIPVLVEGKFYTTRKGYAGNSHPSARNHFKKLNCPIEFPFIPSLFIFSLFFYFKKERNEIKSNGKKGKKGRIPCGVRGWQFRCQFGQQNNKNVDLIATGGAVVKCIAVSQGQLMTF